MRLIDADALIQSLEKKHELWHELVGDENKEIEFAHSYALNVIRNAPTAVNFAELALEHRVEREAYTRITLQVIDEDKQEEDSDV